MKMNIVCKDICCECGCLNAFVIQYTNPFNDDKSIIINFYCLTTQIGVLFCENEEVLETYILKEGKWNRKQKTSHKRIVDDKRLNDDFIKKMKIYSFCPYKFEHEIYGLNKK